MTTPTKSVPPDANGPLGTIRVLDLTTFLSGPYATQILGDLGAEIIKVESPEGDATRTLPPYFVGPDSAYYLSVNRNKYSLAADMKNPEGLAIVRDLIMSSDVVVENFRTGVLERLGITYESFQADHPSLVWCSISGFGQDGPYRDRPAYDMIVQAMSGGMSLTGETDGPSVRSGIPLGDLAAGMFGVIGVLAALHERQATGLGRRIDVAMLDCQISMLSYQAAYHLISGVVPGRQGRGHDSFPTYRSFASGDGSDLVITANTERMWQALCDVIGKPELVQDHRFKELKTRHDNRRELWQIIEEALSTRPAAEWVDLMLAAGIPAAAVNTLDRSLSDPQVLHRDMVVSMVGPAGEAIRVAGNPVKLMGSPPKAHRYPPSLGADNDLVLSQKLRLSEDRIIALKSSGAIGARHKTKQTDPASGKAGAA